MCAVEFGRFALAYAVVRFLWKTVDPSEWV